MMGDQKVNLLDLLSEFNTQKGLLHIFHATAPFLCFDGYFSSAYR